MPLLSLPNELILQVSRIQSIRELNSFSKTNRRLNLLITPVLIDRVYQLCTRNETYAAKTLYWAAERKAVGWLLNNIISTLGRPDATKAAVETLLECGVGADSPGYKGWTPLILTSFHGYIDTVRLLVSHRDVNINAQDDDLRTPLAFAVQRGYKEVVQTLLSHPLIDVNLADRNHCTPLHTAAGGVIRGGEEIVKLLLQDPRVDVNVVNKVGWTPLHIAAATGTAAAVRLLCDDPRVNVNAPNKRGWPPLQLAEAYLAEGPLRALLKCERIDVNLALPLHSVIRRRKEALARILVVDKRVSVNARDLETGDTPLHIAALMDFDVVVRLLLGRGDIDLSVTNTEGKTVGMLAEGYSPRIRKVLRNHAVFKRKRVN
ncbi:ankyrin [Tuber magnatum]|uniref:Ankyrin n=1 Tax=Tuber magnatum TaxID=42249 RepID=A0A317SIP2_9PEZI|nr:ankyrin [Tuber magnatum]